LHCNIYHKINFNMKKIYIKSLVVAGILGFSLATSSQIINTVAGNGSGGYSGDGGQATAAEINAPWALDMDASGNLYISDFGNNAVRLVNSSGVINTLAGNGISGYSGDGGQATAAELKEAAGTARDAAGNIYIADWGNARIRIVSSSGVIKTFAGTGVAGYSGDAGQATAAQLNDPVGVVLDANGNLYVADQSNNRIRMINTSGIISTFAGNGTGGYSGDGGQATAAEINEPLCITRDLSGNIYFGDFSNSRVRVINTSGIINTVAGNGIGGYSGDGGQATAAEISQPSGLGVDASGDLFIAEQGNDRVRVVMPSGIINTFAGIGVFGFSGDGGQATAAEISSPSGIAVDASGNVIFVDRSNERLRKVGSLVTNVPNISAVNQVAVYPNPTSGSFVVTGILPGQVIQLYNYVGQKISSTTAENSSMQFDLSSQANGIYLVRILSKDGNIVSTGKIVKAQ
jgi:hypothetical protein